MDEACITNILFSYSYSFELLKPNTKRTQVAILDFGSQYSHLIARRVREMHVYCELYSCLVSAEELGKHSLTAVILSGGPNSVYEEGAPHVSKEIWEMLKERNVPILGICYGMQVGLVVEKKTKNDAWLCKCSRFFCGTFKLISYDVVQ